MTAEQEMMAKLDKLHTTPLGAERIARNIGVNAENGNIVITSTQEA